MALTKINYVSGKTVITAENLNDIQDAILDLERKGGVGMGITGATVGQIAKISAVDASGVPTAWEPVDMASGGTTQEVKLTAAVSAEQSLTIDNRAAEQTVNLAWDTPDAKTIPAFTNYYVEKTAYHTHAHSTQRDTLRHGAVTAITVTRMPLYPAINIFAQWNMKWMAILLQRSQGGVTQ